MPKRAAHSGTPQRVIWSAPLRELAKQLRAEAGEIRTLVGSAGITRASERDAIADRIEAGLKESESCEWIATIDAAALLKMHPDTVRARCRRVLSERGQAEKRGGLWYVHRSALERTAA